MRATDPTRSSLRRTFRAGATVVAAGLLLGACIKSDPDLVEGRNPAEWRSASYRVAFLPLDSKLRASQRTGLDAWVRKTALQRDEFLVVVIRSSPDHQFAHVQRRRAERIVRHLTRKGVPVSNIVEAEDPTLATAARLVVGRARIEASTYRRACGKKCKEVVTVNVPVAPACADWTRVQLGGDMRGSRAKFGCVVDSALHSMVVNKRDLVTGRTPGPAEAVTMGHGVRTYRDGKLTIIEPTASKTTDTGANSVGGGSK